jgi:hypothetical protein
VIRLKNVIPVKAGIHKSVVIPISYLNSCLCRNDIKRGHHGKIYSKKKFLDFIVVKKLHQDKYGMRKTNFNDEVNREIITSIFPRKVPHKDISGANKEMSIFDYFSTHFNMSSGKTTPRLILMYIERCFEKTREYYEKNPDIKELLLENNEYPLVKKPLLRSAYYDLQNEIWDAVCKVSQVWEDWINILRINKRQGEMKFQYLKSIIPSKNEDEIKHFLGVVIK